LDVNKLLELRRGFGDDLVLKYEDAKLIDKGDLFFLPVDILVPGSRPWVINESNVDGVKAKVVSSGANIPFTDEAEERLFRRGVTVVPDFIANSGGTTASQAGRFGLNMDQAFEAIRKIMRTNTLEILEAAAKEKTNPTKIAKQRAIEMVQKASAGQVPSFEEYEKGFRELVGTS
jgi:glutamate dehydrogenase/leucine dehydrogenase